MGMRAQGKHATERCCIIPCDGPSILWKEPQVPKKEIGKVQVLALGRQRREGLPLR